MFNLDEFLKKMLNSRASASEQRYIERQLEREENNQSEVSDLRWLGVDSNTGEGVALNANNQPIRGNIIFNSQQIPGQSAQSLNASRQTFNAMPAPYSGQIARVQYIPRIVRGKVAIIAELIYEGVNPIPCSCEPQVLFGDIGILFYTLHRNQGSHNPGLCTCERNWALTDAGCVPSCSGTGEFTSFEECEMARTRRAQSRIAYEKITSRYLGSASLDFQAIDGTQFTNAGEFYFFPGAVIIAAKSGAMITSYTPNLSDDSLGVFGIGNGQTIGWADVNVYEFTNAYIQYYRPGNLIATLVVQNSGSYYSPLAKKPWPSSATVISGNLDLTTIPHGIIAWREDDSSLTGFVLDFRIFGRWVGDYINKPIPLAPFRNFSDPPPPIDGEEDGEIYHYTIKFWFGGEVQNPIELGEYLFADHATARNIYWQYNIEVPDAAYQPTNFFASSSSAYGVLSNAYMCAIGKNEYEIVISSGKFTEANELAPDTQSNKYLYCQKEVITIKDKQLSNRVTYKYPENVSLHINNKLSFWLNDWRCIDYGGRIYTNWWDTPNLGDHDKLFDLVDINNSSKFNVAIREYIKSHFQFLMRYNSPRIVDVSGEITYVQGRRIGSDAMHPHALAEMGISWIEGGVKNYVIDVGLNQWVNSANDIFCDAIRSKNLEVTVKVGEFEYFNDNGHYPNFVNRGDASYTYNFLCHHKIKNPKGIALKVLSLKNEYAGIIEACCWIDSSDIEAANLDIYSNVYLLPIYRKNYIGEWWELVPLGDYNYSEKYPFISLEQFGTESLYNLEGIWRWSIAPFVDMTPQFLIIKKCDGSISVDLSLESGYFAINGGSSRLKIIGRC